MHWRDARKSERYWTKRFGVVPMRRQFLLTISWRKKCCHRKKGNKREVSFRNKVTSSSPFFWSLLRDIWDSLYNISPDDDLRLASYKDILSSSFSLAIVRLFVCNLYEIATSLKNVAQLNTRITTWHPTRRVKAPNLVRMGMLMLLNLPLQWC